MSILLIVPLIVLSIRPILRFRADWHPYTITSRPITHHTNTNNTITDGYHMYVSGTAGAPIISPARLAPVYNHESPNHEAHKHEQTHLLHPRPDWYTITTRPTTKHTNTNNTITDEYHIPVQVSRTVGAPIISPTRLVYNHESPNHEQPNHGWIWCTSTRVLCCRRAYYIPDQIGIQSRINHPITKHTDTNNPITNQPNHESLNHKSHKTQSPTSKHVQHNHTNHPITNIKTRKKTITNIIMKIILYIYWCPVVYVVYDKL